MWNWLKRRLPANEIAALRSLREERYHLLGQVEALRATHVQLCAENAELRAIIVSLDETCTQLSVKLYGQEAVDRMIAQHWRSGIN